MKTSSKLLIVLGIALFVVPVSIMAFSVLTGRVDASEYREVIEKEKSTLAVEDVYLQTHSLQAFQHVAVESEGRSSVVNLVFVKSDQYAVKTTKDNDFGLKFNVNDEGVLIIRAPESFDYYNNNVYVFAPVMHRLDLRHVNVSVKIETDSLFVQADSVDGFRLFNGTKIENLNLQANNSVVQMSGPERSDEVMSFVLGDLQLDFSNSWVTLQQLGWKRVAMHAKDSKVNFINKDRKWKLNDLTLSTEGAVSIGVDSLQTANLSGSISDQTTIDLPVYQLRKLMNKN